jgi:hypothetical protein
MVPIEESVTNNHQEPVVAALSGVARLPVRPWQRLVY